MKQPNWKTPLILSAVLLVFGTFAYWLEYSYKPKKEKEGTQTKKPLVLPATDTQVAMIKIKSAQGLIEIKCESLGEKTCTPDKLGKWKITHPLPKDSSGYITDADAVKTFLDDITDIIATETITLDDETPEKRKTLMKEYGLTDEQRALMETHFVEIVLENGKRLTAWFGQELPVGDKTFVGSSTDGVLNDKIIFLISNQFKQNTFNKSVTSFRDKALFSFSRKDVTAFKSARLDLKKTNGLWVVNGLPANFDRVETVLSAIANAKATEFVDASTVKGLSPFLTYELTIQDKKHTLALYQKVLAEKKLPDDGHGHEKLPAEKHYYAKSSQLNEFVEVEALLRNNIDKIVNELRQNEIFSETEKALATSLKVQGLNFSDSPEFISAKGKWEAKDKSKNWDAAVAEKLVELLISSRVKDFVKSVALGKAILTFVIGDEKNAQKFHYSFYLVKDKLYAKNLNDKTNEAYLMDDSMSTALPKAESAWKIKTTAK